MLLDMVGKVWVTLIKVLKLVDIIHLYIWVSWCVIYDEIVVTTFVQSKQQHMYVWLYCTYVYVNTSLHMLVLSKQQHMYIHMYVYTCAHEHECTYICKYKYKCVGT